MILTINKNNSNQEANIVELYDRFEYKNNYCMVFEKLGPSLYDFLQHNNYQGTFNNKNK